MPNPFRTIKIIILITTIGLAFLGTAYFLLKNPHPSSIPLVFENPAKGCREIFVYRTNADDTMGISVTADKNKLHLSKDEKIFEISKTPGLNVEILKGQHIERFYCNDVLYLNEESKQKKLIGKSGTVTIRLGDPVEWAPPNWEKGYKATVILNNATFSDDKGRSIDTILDNLTFENVTVGWIPN